MYTCSWYDIETRWSMAFYVFFILGLLSTNPSYFHNLINASENESNVFAEERTRKINTDSSVFFLQRVNWGLESPRQFPVDHWWASGASKTYRVFQGGAPEKILGCNHNADHKESMKNMCFIPRWTPVSKESELNLSGVRRRSPGENFSV